MLLPLFDRDRLIETILSPLSSSVVILNLFVISVAAADSLIISTGELLSRNGLTGGVVIGDFKGFIGNIHA